MKFNGFSTKLLCMLIAGAVFSAVIPACPEAAAGNKLDEARALVLMYRGIVKKPDGKNVTVESFKKQMDVLKRNGYRTIRLKQLLDFYYNGGQLPPRSVLITFDGGRKDSYRYADKVLKETGYNAVMFIIPEKSNAGDHFFVCWHDVKNMLKSKRWEFGLCSGKGYKHVTLTPHKKEGPYLLHRAWLEQEKRHESDEELSDRITKEYTGLRRQVKKEIKGLELYALSIPYGKYHYWKNAETFCISMSKQLVKENFKLLFLQGTDGIVTEHDNPLQLGRLIVYPDWTEADFSRYVVRVEKKLGRPWILVVGNAFKWKGKLFIHPYEEKREAFIYISGSEKIDNCVIEAEAAVNPGSQFWIYAKFFDKNTYVRFGISDGIFYLQNRQGNSLQQVVSKDIIEDEKIPHTYKLMVKQDSVIAVLDGSYFGKVAYINKPGKGTIALETWNETNGTAGAELSYFRLQRFIICLTPENADDISRYKDIFVDSSIFLPLCFKSENGRIFPVADINLMRMLSGYHKLFFIPRIYLATFKAGELGSFKQWLSSLFEEYALGGINIELSDAVCKDVHLIDTLINGLKRRFDENGMKLVLTVKVPPSLEDYYTKTASSKCDYIIIKNRRLTKTLAAAIKADNRLIRSMSYKKAGAGEKDLIKYREVALWGEKEL